MEAAQGHISKAKDFVASDKSTDAGGTAAAKSLAHATIAIAVSLDRIANALERPVAASHAGSLVTPDVPKTTPKRPAPAEKD